METLRSVLAIAVWTTVPPVFLFWFLIHPFVGYWRSVGPARTYLVVGPLCLLTAGVLFRLRRPVVASDLGTHMGLFAVGVALWGVSVFLERGIRRHLDFRTLVGVPQLDPGTDGALLREGPYARVRHPRYLASFIGILGWSLMANHGAIYLLVALLVPAFGVLVRLEEAELVARYGSDYEAYRRRVPAILPRAGRG